MAQAKGGKKNRKYGRNTKSPAMKRYQVENRAAVNKAKRIAKHKKAMLKAVERIAKALKKKLGVQ